MIKLATIDGNTFQLTEIAFKTTSRTRKSGSAGGDTSGIVQSGYEGLDISIRGYATSVSDYDSVIAAFLAPGAHTLKIRTGWQYTVYGVGKRITEPAGIPDGFFSFEVQCVCADPYQYSDTEKTRTRTIGDIDEEWDEDDDTNEITTVGTVAAKPDIMLVAAGSESATVLKQANKFT